MNTPKIRRYVAQQRNVMVLLYRKTSKVTYVVHLNYDKKSEDFILGSRFYGKFYPNRCDISNDGKYFLYFAMGQSQKKYKERLYGWTDICKPPALKAEFLLEHNDTWGGGGRFINQNIIAIAPGASPGFDVSKEIHFDQYKLTYDDQVLDNGWGSGKNWELIKYQINEKLGEKYPIPGLWTKTNGKITLNRRLLYSFFLKSKKGKI